MLASFGAEAGLNDKMSFTVDFEADGTTWIASSNGLYRYDGYRWERFGAEHGLPSDHIRCATVTADGQLWIGTDRGTGTFDGETFDDTLTRGRLAGPSVRRIFEDSGGTLWFCCDRWPDPNVTSGLSRLEAGEWTTFGIESGLPSDYVSDVFRDSRGNVFVLTSSGLAQLDGSRFTLPLVKAGLSDCDDYLWSIVESPVHGLMVSSDSDVFVRSGDVWQKIAIERPVVAPKLAVLDDGDIVFCSVVGGMARFYRWTGDGFEPVDHECPVVGAFIQQAAAAPDGSMWAIGGVVVRWQPDGHRWVSYPRLPVPCGTDRDGGAWFADPQRVLRHDLDGWAQVVGGRAPLFLASSGAVWMRQNHSVAKWDEGSLTSYPPTPILVGRRSSFHEDGRGTIWVLGNRTADGEQLMRFDGTRWIQVTVPRESAGDFVRDVSAHTGSGLCLLIGNHATDVLRLDHFEGDGVTTVSVPAECRSSRVTGLFVDDDGSLWLYGFAGAFRRGPARDSAWARVNFPGETVSSVVRGGDGLWVSYSGDTGGRNGVSCFRGGRWEEVSGDQWRFFGRGQDGTIIYKAPGGLVSIGKKADAPGLRLLPRGLEVSRAVVGSPGEAWISSGDSVLRYRPDGIPPETIIVGSPSATEGDALTLEVLGIRRFRSRLSPAIFRVAVRVDGDDWQDHGRLEDKVTLADLETGSHQIEVRVEDETGMVDPSPARVLATVWPVPLQDRGWFRAVTLAMFAVVFGLAAAAFVGWRRVGDQARGLEATVRERTAEVAVSERRYRSLFEQSRDAVLILDVDLQVVEANPAAVELLEREFGQFDACPLDQLIDDLELKTALETALETGDEPPALRAQIRAQSGIDRDVMVSANFRFDEDGKSAGMRLMLRDVTHQRKIEDRLRQTQKMEAVGRLAAGIAHDFNNILTGIIGHSELIRMKAADPSVLSDVESILRQATRATALTSRIKGFSRHHVQGQDVVDVSLVMAGAEPLLRAVIGEHVQLVTKLDPDAGHARIDPVLLEQVVINLAINARDAMPENGVLTVAVGRSETGSGFESQDDQQWVALTVRDTGQGMDAQTRERIFEPFFTTKPSALGTGLGLSIVQGIVTDCGGTIQVESTPGAGTVFKVRFPACNAEPKGEFGDRPDREAIPKARGTILVVEDQPDVQELMRRLLVQCGYKVKTASDGVTALECLDAMERMVDLVISDIMMPGMDGHTLANHLRMRDECPPILLVSGFSDLEPSQPTHDIPVLEKPFSPTGLLARVASLLGTAPEMEPVSEDASSA